MPVFPFNPQQFNFSTPRERLPRGWYPAVIESSEIVATSKGDGFRLILFYLVIDGPAKGRKLQCGYNISNPNLQAVEIAMSELKTLNACIGNFQPINQTEEMHNKPLQILLTEPKDSDFNEVKGYKTIHGEDADKIGAGAPVGHVAQPSQGYAQPTPAPAYAPAPAPAWQPTPAPAYAPAPAPAWQPTPAPAYPQPPAYQPQQAPSNATAAPVWQPGAPQPQAPAWAPQK